MRFADRIWFRTEYRWWRGRTSVSDLQTIFLPILISIWQSMSTVAHIGKQFRIDFQNDCPIDAGFDLGSDGHGGALREAIGRSILASVWLPMAAVAHIGKRLVARFCFGSGFPWPRWRTSGSD